MDTLHTLDSRLKTMYVVVARTEHVHFQDTICFSEEDYFEFAYSNNYESLFSRWALSGFDPLYLPTTLRLDDSKHWTLDNLHLGTLGDAIDACPIASSEKAEKTSRDESKYGMDHTQD